MGNMNYEYFQDKEERKELSQIGNNLARFIFENNIKSIVFLDRSARFGYLVLRGAWKNKYPDIPLPKIYFTNPDGYNQKERNILEILDEFQTRYKKLYASKNEPVMIFDTCMHEGKTMGRVYDFLKNAGFQEVFVGLTQPKDSDYKKNKQKVDFCGLKEEPTFHCYPFRRYSEIKKSKESIICSKDPYIIPGRVSQLRKELSSLC